MTLSLFSEDLHAFQVKLLTAEGNLKYETECNPSNGYYMIPVYNKAVYSIRVFAPEGWYFGGLCGYLWKFYALVG